MRGADPETSTVFGETAYCDVTRKGQSRGLRHEFPLSKGKDCIDSSFSGNGVKEINRWRGSHIKEGLFHRYFLFVCLETGLSCHPG